MFLQLAGSKVEASCGKFWRMSNVIAPDCDCATGETAGAARSWTTDCLTVAWLGPLERPAALALVCVMVAVWAAHCCCDPIRPHPRVAPCTIVCSTVAVFWPPPLPFGSTFWLIVHDCEIAAGEAGSASPSLVVSRHVAMFAPPVPTWTISHR